jgi:cytochrome c553
LGINLAHAEAGRLMAPNNAKWKEECGSCHVPYPPRLLSADNWQQLMGGLKKHFGANAELVASDNKKILSFLESNAGSGKQYSSVSLRISDTPWFRHEHHVISEKEWINPEVKSRSNCSACHGKVVLGN